MYIKSILIHIISISTGNVNYMNCVECGQRSGHTGAIGLSEEME